MIMLGLALMSALENAGYVIALFVGAPAAITIIWFNITAGIKRLHDREKPGWWLWVFWFIPGLSNLTSPDNAFGVIFLLLSVGLSIWGFVELACLKGTTGPNTYGPDPLADGSNVASAPPAL